MTDQSDRKICNKRHFRHCTGRFTFLGNPKKKATCRCNLPNEHQGSHRCIWCKNWFR